MLRTPVLLSKALLAHDVYLRLERPTRFKSFSWSCDVVNTCCYSPRTCIPRACQSFSRTWKEATLTLHVVCMNKGTSLMRNTHPPVNQHRAPGIGLL